MENQAYYQPTDRYFQRHRRNSTLPQNMSLKNAAANLDYHPKKLALKSRKYEEGKLQKFSIPPQIKPDGVSFMRINMV